MNWCNCCNTPDNRNEIATVMNLLALDAMLEWVQRWKMNPKPTILYVEDDPNNRMLIQRILVAEGFEIYEASDAAQALKILEFHKPDLILMDINMPDIDGYTLTAEIRKIPDLSNVPIVAVTANVMRGDRERTLEAGCDGYIQKPIDVDALPRQIRLYLKEVSND